MVRWDVAYPVKDGVRVHSAQGVLFFIGERISTGVVHDGRADDGREAPIVTDEDGTGIDFLLVFLDLENHDEDGR